MSTISVNCSRCHRDNWLVHEACTLTKVDDSLVFSFACIHCGEIHLREYSERTTDLILAAGVPVSFMEEGLAAVPSSSPDLSTCQRPETRGE